VRARFSHPAFGARPSDATRWKGELYADLRNTDLAAWKQYFDYPFTLQRGRGSVRAWLDFDHARLAGFTADLAWPTSARAWRRMRRRWRWPRSRAGCRRARPSRPASTTASRPSAPSATKSA
jgi:uncharacterized protein YhdP